MCTGSLGSRLLTFQDFRAENCRPATRRLSKVAFEHVDDRVREGHVRFRILHLCRCQALTDHHERHVSHNLRGGRYLHDIAEHLVHVSIGLRDFVPALFEPEAARLCLEVGKLTTGHFVQIDFRRGGLKA